MAAATRGHSATRQWIIRYPVSCEGCDNSDGDSDPCDGDSNPEHCVVWFSSSATRLKSRAGCFSSASRLANGYPPASLDNISCNSFPGMALIRSTPVPLSTFLLEFHCLSHTELPANADSDFVKGPIFELLTSVFDIGTVPMWNPSECQLLYDKIKSNYFESSAGASLFEACSMLNHSCCPNVQFDPYTPDDLQVIQPVAKGEQLFISYQVEAQYLPELYGFHCDCEKCTSKVSPRLS